MLVQVSWTYCKSRSKVTETSLTNKITEQLKSEKIDLSARNERKFDKEVKLVFFTTYHEYLVALNEAIDAAYLLATKKK